MINRVSPEKTPRIHYSKHLRYVLKDCLRRRKRAATTYSNQNTQIQMSLVVHFKGQERGGSIKIARKETEIFSKTNFVSETKIVAFHCMLAIRDKRRPEMGTARVLCSSQPRDWRPSACEVWTSTRSLSRLLARVLT